MVAEVRALISDLENPFTLDGADEEMEKATGSVPQASVSSPGVPPPPPAPPPVGVPPVVPPEVPLVASRPVASLTETTAVKSLNSHPLELLGGNPMKSDATIATDGRVDVRIGRVEKGDGKEDDKGDDGGVGKDGKQSGHQIADRVVNQIDDGNDNRGGDGGGGDGVDLDKGGMTRDGSQADGSEANATTAAALPPPHPLTMDDCEAMYFQGSTTSERVASMLTIGPYLFTGTRRSFTLLYLYILPHSRSHLMTFLSSR